MGGGGSAPSNITEAHNKNTVEDICMNGSWYIHKRFSLYLWCYAMHDHSQFNPFTHILARDKCKMKNEGVE